jgi:poly-gamma-glutamate synthesis protein (capsule biosynthesis protein)
MLRADAKGSGLVFASTGDSIIVRKMSVFKEERFLAMIKILREADVATTNLEMLLHRYENPPGKGALYGPMFLAADPFIAHELKWAGIDIVSCATNHAGDYTYGGLMSTVENVKMAGLLAAGAGRNLTEARAPVYFDTEKGTVAMVAACTSFESWEMASEPRGPIMGRPGINGIRHYLSIDPESAKEIKEMAKRLGVGGYAELGQDPVLRDGEFRFFGQLFVIENRPEKGVKMRGNESDLEANLRSIRCAARQADYVLVSLHFHQTDPNTFPEPPEFILRFARTCIDAGADAFIGHGPQVLGPVEVYKGKPIFHSLGTFFVQGELVEYQPAIMYERYRLESNGLTSEAMDAHFRVRTNPLRWKSVIAVTTLSGPHGRISEMRLYPVTMSGDMRFEDMPRSQRGRPMLANEEQSREIIQRLGVSSSAYGTRIEYKDGLGILKLP